MRPIFASPVDAVELLLKCRDERAARIAEEYESIMCWCPERIAALIRSEE